MKLIEKNPILMIILGVIGISLSAIFVRYSTAPSAVTACFRLLWSVALLAPAAFRNRREFNKLNRKTVWLSILNGICLAAHFVLWFESLKHTTVAASTVIVCTEVLWVALGFWLFLKGRIPKAGLMAIGLTLLGSVLIAWGDLSGGGLYGDLLSLLAAVAVGAYTLIGRVVRRNTSTTVYTFLVYGSCSVALLITCLLQGAPLWGYGKSPLIVGLLLAVFSTILGHSIFSWCLKYFSPAFVSASKLCEPVVAGIIAALLFGEVPGWLQLAGGVLILAGICYYSIIEKRSSNLDCPNLCGQYKKAPMVVNI